LSPHGGQIAAAGMKVVKVQDNPTYQSIWDNARGASKKFGVKSISLLAVKSQESTWHCRHQRPQLAVQRNPRMSAYPAHDRQQQVDCGC